jgi:hypothetical protein
MESFLVCPLLEGRHGGAWICIPWHLGVLGDDRHSVSVFVMAHQAKNICKSDHFLTPRL